MKATQYSASQLAEIIDGNHTIQVPNCIVSHLIIDSRKAFALKNALFIALKGDVSDGHQFVESLYQQGVRNFLISQPVKKHLDANYFYCANTLKALQHLGENQRNTFTKEVIAITGSNGKTIVKEWLFQLLHTQFKIVKSPKSYNSQIGVPLSVWNLNPSFDLGIFEAGISYPKEMTNLANIIQPTVGIFTNIGQAHQENFQNVKEKIQEKLRLFKSVHTLIFEDQENDVSGFIKSSISSKKLLSWGTHAMATVQITGNNSQNGITHLNAKYSHQKYTLKIPFTDSASVQNATHCWVYLMYLGLTNHQIQDQFKRLEPIQMRMEQKEGLNHSIILNDSYNADITGLAIASAHLNTLGKPKTTIILSDILQSGMEPELLAQQINAILKQQNIHQFIGIGKSLYEMQTHISVPNASFFSNTDTFINHISQFSFANNAILIKGARKFKFEQITQRLVLKSHQTQLEINLDAIKHNLLYYQGVLNPDVKTMVMVKAYGYGSGGPEVARLLATNKVDYLGVAYADEGVAIRNAGISAPIMVMNPSEEAFSTLISYDLEPEIYSLHTLQQYIDVLQKEGVFYGAHHIHLKVDTGMNRLGFHPDEVAEAIALIKQENGLKVASVFSHLAGSDSAQFDDFTHQQAKTFYSISQVIEKELGYPVIKHLLNTAGIERFPQYQYNMVRLGIGLYGISSAVANANYLQPVAALRSIIAQIKHINKGETIGYSRAFTALQDMKIGIVPLGYADGLDRRMGNKTGNMFVNGKECPIVGNICMDLTMIDLSRVEAQVNDTVEIFGKNISVNKIANQIGTIPYEVIATIPARVKRLYLKEDS